MNILVDEHRPPLIMYYLCLADIPRCIGLDRIRALLLVFSRNLGHFLTRSLSWVWARRNIWWSSGIDALPLKQSFVIPKSIRQHLLSDMLLSLSRWSWGLEDAVDLVICTRTAWSLPIALDFPLSTTDASEGRSAGHKRGGGGSGGEHNRHWPVYPVAKLAIALS